MVSFQCHGCGDVVKKPKLDQHQSRCHGGFDCIDCSTPFNTPAEYKSHTSCISEAEKYQKALYKGPKTGNNRNYQQNNGPTGHGGNFSNGYQNQRGGYRGRPSWNQPRNQATGSNDTPLGKPQRMSPVTKVDEPERPNPATNVVVESTQTMERVTEGKIKEKSKKRKPEDEPDRENDGVLRKKVKVVDEAAVDSPPIPPSNSPEEGKKKKKGTKEKKERKAEKDVRDDMAVDVDVEEKRKKEKRAKKDKSEQEVNDDMTEDKERRKKEKREKKERQRKDVGEESKEKKEKKDKKDKAERKKVKSEK